MALHEARDGKLRSTQRSKEFMWWQPSERKYLKPLHVGRYGTWQLIRGLQRRKSIRWE